MAEPRLANLNVVKTAEGNENQYLLQQILNRLEEQVEKRSPFARSEYVDVTFSLGADTDTDVPTTLTPTDPDAIRYVVVKADRACDIYQDLTATRKAWQPGYIILRCNTASAVVRLLLFTER